MELEKKIKIIKDIKRDVELKAKSWNIFNFSYEDIEQILYLSIWEKLDRFDETRGSPRTFCVKIMNNVLRNLYRDENRKSLNHAILLGDKYDVTDSGKLIIKK